jgi:flagellar M-ring protein FliF
MKRLSVAVAVDGVTAVTKDGKPGAYTPRSAEEMRRIEELVRSAVGYDEARGDKVTVSNVQFARDALTDGGVVAGSPLAGFDKNDIMRAAELGILAIVAALVIFFVVRPLLTTANGGGNAGAGGMGQLALAGQQGSVPAQLTYERAADGSMAALAAPGEIEQRIDIARIEGQVKASSIRSVADFVEKHPEESVAILRGWLHEAT